MLPLTRSCLTVPLSRGSFIVHTVYDTSQIIQQFRNVSYHFYADDIQIYCSLSESEFHLVSSLLECLSCIDQWLTNIYLQRNSKKTETLIISPDDKIVLIKQHLASLSSSVQSGVVFDQSMSSVHHVGQVAKISFYNLTNNKISNHKCFYLILFRLLELTFYLFKQTRLKTPSVSPEFSCTSLDRNQ